MPDNNYSSVGYPRPVGEENKLPQSAENAALGALAPLELKCANAFDPSVTGLAAGIGARCTTIDLTKCWIKYGAGDTQWGATHAITGTFGSNVATWDTTALMASLACNTLGGFRLTCNLVLSGGATQVLCLRVNGTRVADNAVATSFWTQIPGLAASTAGYKKARLAEMGDGTWVNLVLECRHAKSGSAPWTMTSLVAFRHSPTYPGATTQAYLTSLEATPIAEITSVGLAVTSDAYAPEGTMGAASVATIERI